MRSLTSRLTLGAVVVLATFIALTALALEQAFERSARSASGERLSAQLYLLIAATEVDGLGRLQMPERFAEPRLTLPGSGLYGWIADDRGRPLWRSPSAIGLSDPLPEGGEGLRQQRSGSRDYLVTTLTIKWDYNDGSLPLQIGIAEELSGYRQELARYRNTLWGWLGGMALLLLLALALTLYWGLRPLRRAAAEVAAIESGAQQRLAQTYPRELQRLTGNINTLLEHEHTQQRRYKDALADLAHSLKTPLAVLRGMDQSSAPRLLDEQVTRMDEIVQYQLLRAVSASRRALATPQPVSPIVGRLLATLSKVYRDKAVQVEQQLDPAARFRGDEGDLMELLGNLLDNAYKWCTSRVLLTTSVEGARLTLSVEDDGPGIPAEQQQAILSRGIRLDEATPGHGIGLAMVRDIIEGYGGHLTIGHSPLGGARLQVVLPG